MDGYFFKNPLNIQLYMIMFNLKTAIFLTDDIQDDRKQRLKMK